MTFLTAKQFLLLEHYLLTWRKPGYFACLWSLRAALVVFLVVVQVLLTDLQGTQPFPPDFHTNCICGWSSYTSITIPKHFKWLLFLFAFRQRFQSGLTLISSCMGRQGLSAHISKFNVLSTRDTFCFVTIRWVFCYPLRKAGICKPLKVKTCLLTRLSKSQQFWKR